MIEKEEPYPSVMFGMTDGHFGSFLPDVLDNGTDKLMLYTALDMSSEGSIIERALNMYNSWHNSNYSYYWHGYVSVLRPLLFLLNYGDLRTLNGVIQLFLVGMLAWQIKAKRGWRYVLLLFTVYIVLSPIAISISLQYTWVFYIAILTGLSILCCGEYLEQKSRYVFLFFAVGMLTSYFDLLTYPLFTWGFPIVCWVICKKPEILRLLKQTVMSGFMWLLGYAGMWIAKWRISDWVLGGNVYETAMKEVEFRSATGDYALSGLSYRLEAIYVNWKHYMFTVFFIILAVWFLWAFCNYFFKGFKKCGRCPALFLISCSSICWCFYAANHVQIHHFFTYRIFAVSVFAILAIILESTSERKLVDSLNWKYFLCRGIIIAGIAVLAGGFTLMAREDFEVDNYFYSQLQKIPISESESLWTELIPTYSHISQFDFNADTQELPEQGYFEVKIWDGEKLLYQEKINASSCVDWKGSCKAVDWRMKAGKIYKMEISAHDIGQDTWIMFTPAGEEKLLDIGDSVIDGNPVDGELASHIVYRTRPISHKTLIFLAATWMCVIMSMILAIGELCHLKSKVLYGA